MRCRYYSGTGGSKESFVDAIDGGLGETEVKSGGRAKQAMTKTLGSEKASGSDAKDSDEGQAETRMG